ncbi:halocyanin domain-containing protein [Halovenus sp. HT40]|uniref:halocyanin domain-containing protein n=1 Tax=Halovenus sp. HT40 TaxID=3126691 RepID=UPI00300F6006
MTNRRTYLRRLGAGVGLALLAGCVDEDAAENNDNSDGDQPDEEPNDDGVTAGDTTAALDSPPAPVDDALRERDTQNYDGEIANMLESDSVEITVGGGENGLAFDPPVVQVAPGTQVTWRWSGDGGAHNVLAMEPEGAFDSGDPVAEQETTYSATFEEEGNYLYACQPHRAIGMWGAVVVGEGGEAEPNGTNDGDSEPPEPDYDGPAAKADEYLEDNDAQQYDGEFTDFTGQDSVTISVGGGESGLSFDPPAVIVDPGTEIVWEWTGEGGAHNVVSAEESASKFDSGEIVQSETRTYTTVVEETGAYLYYCTPHQAVGMHGAIVVEG